MGRIKKYIGRSCKPVFVGAMIFAVSGCSDFLDENPDNRVALDNLEKAAQLLVSAYSVASPNFTDWMSDDIPLQTIGTNLRLNHQQLYSWDDVTTGPTDQDTPDYYWFQTYDAIAHANEVLNILDGIPLNSEEDQARKDAIRSEALLTRAYGHFMLVNFFAQHVGRSGANRGVPYVKDPETTFLGQYERLSVTRVYNEVEDDLLEALDLVDDSFFNNSGKYHFNRNAALAFASRFYLFQGDFVRCKQYSDQLLGNNPGAFVRDLTGLDFRAASASITEYPQLYTSPDINANLLLMRKLSLVQRTDFAFGPDVNSYRSLFGSSPFGGFTDTREDPALTKGQNGIYPLRYQSLFERSSLNSNVGFPYYIHLAFTGEEVLLNRAESNVRLGNIPEAVTDLQALTERRFTDGAGNKPTLTLSGIRDFVNSGEEDLDLLIYIIEVERRKEFIMQGMRWFDIKRFGFTVQHTFIDGSSAVLSADDPRKAFQIPQSAIDVGGLEPNPR
ncbi:MAG: RagB/SusD family nutrient uptake outer membrane protein [Bacteroidota bacterium]